MEFLIYLALVRGPHESHQGAHLGGIAVEGRESVRKEMRRGRNGEWAQGWHRLATTLSYQAPPLAARALIQRHTLDPGPTVTRELAIHSPPPVSNVLSELTHLLALLPSIVLLLVTSSEQGLSLPAPFVSSLAVDDFSPALP